MSPLLISLLLVCCFGGGWSVDLLYPHTVNNGDTKFTPDCLDCYEAVSITDTYTYYGVAHSTAYVSSKGVLTFTVGWDDYIPSPMSTVDTPMIAALWSDNNLLTLDQGENILYRETQDSLLLARFATDIGGQFTDCGGPDFAPTSLLIATWQRVQSWCPDVFETCWWAGGPPRAGERSTIEHVFPQISRRNVRHPQRQQSSGRTGEVLEGINGFQLVLATDGNGMTFAMLNMHTIDWNCCGSFNVCGFSDGLDTYSHELPDSGTADVDNLTTGSNVGKDGRWVFRVDPCNILDPQCTWMS